MGRFTDHASERLFDRTSLTRTYVKEVIENDFCVILGEENGTRKRHYLFYSSDDDRCFVAVIDEASKEFITILPINYHKRWRISEEALVMAKDLVLNGSNSRFFRGKNSKIGDQVKQKKARVECCLSSEEGISRGPISLGKFGIEELRNLLYPSDFRPDIAKKIMDKDLGRILMAGNKLESLVWSVDGQRCEANPDIIKKYFIIPSRV